MTTISVLVGFALMLFLPCALTVISSRKENNREDGYHSINPVPVVDPVATTRAALPSYPAQIVTDAIVPLDITPQSFGKPQAIDAGTPSSRKKIREARILCNEIEALLASAAVARAQADAFAAKARLAAAKAEAAEADASEAEAAAAAAIEQVRRAA
jgi:hypothetical protein